MSSIFTNVLAYIDEASKYLTVDSSILSVLKRPKKVLEVSFPVRMDDRSVKVFHGWRVQYNDALGPFKGGIRFHPQVTLDEITGLAALMTFKSAALGLPYGGSKGGVVVDPREISTREIEKLSRRYVDAIYPLIGPERDVPAPDINTNPQIMAWMMDEYSRLSGYTVPASFTGKPVEIWGTFGRDISTAFGGVVILEHLLQNHAEYKNKKPKDIKVAIQGFGNVGGNCAKILFKKGYRIVAISDFEGGIFSEAGFDIPKVMQAQKEKGTIDKNRCYPVTIAELKDGIPCESISNRQLLELEVDILIPAALEDQITKENASRIRAPILLEMGNAPTTPEAQTILLNRGVLLIPDILANSGGVVGSYFEWVENLQSYYWSEAEFSERLEKIMRKTVSNIETIAAQNKVNLRTATYIAALDRLAKAMMVRGWVE